jgi:hypothetical protein
MSDPYSRALVYDYERRCEPVSDGDGPFWLHDCGCRCGRCSAPVLATELGNAIEDCDGVQIEVSA